MSRHDPKGYYDVLGVPPSASDDEIVRAFRARAKECHPDRNPDPGAHALFQRLSEAYAVLSAAQGRAAYDGSAHWGPSPETLAKARQATLAKGMVLGLAVPMIAAMVYLQAHGMDGFARLGPSPPAPPHAPAARPPAAEPVAPRPRAVAVAGAASTCARAPDDGALIEGRLDQGARGHLLEVTNGSDGPSIIKLRDIHTGRALVAFFLSKGGHARVGPLPDGDYHVQYAVGPALADDCRSFTRIDRAAEFPDPDRLKTEYRDGGVVTETLSYILYAAQHGNVRAQTIDPTKFLTE